MIMFERWWLQHNKGKTPENSCMSHIGYPEAKAAYREAFELMLEWLEIEEPYETFHARIKGELEE